MYQKAQFQRSRPVPGGIVPKEYNCTRRHISKGVQLYQKAYFQRYSRPLPEGIVPAEQICTIRHSSNGIDMYHKA